MRRDAHFKLYPPLFGLPDSPGSLGIDDSPSSLSEEREVRLESSLEVELSRDDPRPLWADGVVERRQKDEAEPKRTFGSGVGVQGCNVDVLNCTSSCMVIVGGAEAK